MKILSDKFLFSSLTTANMDVLVNNTLGSMAATVRTDSDRSVVTATLEAVEDLLKALQPLSFPMQDRVLSSLVVSVQDILDDKVRITLPHLVSSPG